MAIPGVESALFQHFVPPVSPVLPVRSGQGGRTVTSQDLFIVAFAFYLSQLHQSILDAWSQYREGLTEQAKQNKEAHRKRELEASLEEATRRTGELRSFEDDMQLEFSEGQAARFRYHSDHNKDSDRHLRLPV